MRPVDAAPPARRRRRPGGAVMTTLVVLATSALGMLLLWRVSGVLGGLPGVVLLAVWPYLLLGAPLVPLIALVLRRWVAGSVAVVLVLVMAATVAPRALSEPDDTVGVTLRVLTVNLYYGEADAVQVVDLVQRQQVDVLSLQELTPEAVAGLEDAGVGALMPHSVLDPRPGASGSGLYSRLPLTERPPLPGTQFAMPRARVAPLPNATVDLVTVHLFPPARRSTVGTWRREAAQLPAVSREVTCTVLAGDFNATLDHPPLRTLLGTGYRDAAEVVGQGLTPTWSNPGLAPPLTLDHVLVDSACGVRSVQVIEVRGSDHRAVLAELVVPDITLS